MVMRDPNMLTGCIRIEISNAGRASWGALQIQDRLVLHTYSVSTGLVQITATSNHVLTSTKKYD